MTSYNFSAGPAMLPAEVIERIKSDLPTFADGGSVMEISHRGKPFMNIAEQSCERLKKLLKLPEQYKIIFLQGGATGQFSGVPLNIGQIDTGDVVADYIETGQWSRKAIKEAKRFLSVNVAYSAESNNYTKIDSTDTWSFSSNPSYVHFTPNETINGLYFPFTPELNDVPLVADMSSMILSGPIDVERFGLIYSGAQKNIGPAGITLVICREDLFKRASRFTPSILNYEKQFAADSMLNTPSTFNWYVLNLVLEWLDNLGGLEVIEARNKEKALYLYNAIDSSDFYTNNIETDFRSQMNVPFILANPELDSLFLTESKNAGLFSLKGHRDVGGMRASIYNAMPMEGVHALVAFMDDFVKRYG